MRQSWKPLTTKEANTRPHPALGLPVRPKPSSPTPSSQRPGTPIVGSLELYAAYPLSQFAHGLRIVIWCATPDVRIAAEYAGQVDYTLLDCLRVSYVLRPGLYYCLGLRDDASVKEISEFLIFCAESRGLFFSAPLQASCGYR